MKWFRTVLFLMAAAHGVVAAAGDDLLLTKRAAELRQAPAESSASLASLPLQSPLVRMPARQGPWIQVKTSAGVTGWVHMFDVGSTSAPTNVSNTASGALRGLASFFNGGNTQPKTTAATSTVGIRGLGAEDIANAQPNLDALARAEALRQDAAQAKLFASDALWSARAVEPLPTPNPPTTARTPSAAEK
jgi:hypothetical protein